MSQAETIPRGPPGPGEPAPWFQAAALDGRSDYQFDTAGGRHILMLFLGSAREPGSAAALGTVAAHRALLDDSKACFFGITLDPEDAAAGRIRKQMPGIRFFLDYDRAISRLYGAAAPEGGRVRPFWLLLDPTMRVVDAFALDRGSDAFAALARAVSTPALPDWAPVLMAPSVFEPEFCRTLIDYHCRHGDEDSGVMRDVDGKSERIIDHQYKKRRDCLIHDETLRRQSQARIVARLLPMVERVFQFKATRMERYLVGCYDGGSGGFFSAHRDNTTHSTAHRRFAVTINLNAEDYDGGELRFPEYGERTYRPPTGGAVVFSCGLLHEATPVSRGRRLAFLPFLYDEEAAAIRERNNHLLGDSVSPYRALPAAE
jgi:predicted 2-oxoglutarate/Fe(II)-dependent dioxygenase YbiX